LRLTNAAPQRIRYNNGFGGLGATNVYGQNNGHLTVVIGANAPATEFTNAHGRLAALVTNHIRLLV